MAKPSLQPKTFSYAYKHQQGKHASWMNTASTAPGKHSVFSLILSAPQQMSNSKLTAQSWEAQRFSTTLGQLGNYSVIRRELGSPPPSSFPTSHGLASFSSIPWDSHKFLVYAMSSPTLNQNCVPDTLMLIPVLPRKGPILHLFNF